jgi:pimeloyl-ACP methyl ester carboxylesterase
MFHRRLVRGTLLLPAIMVTASLINACTTTPMEPYSEQTPPLVLLPASEAGIKDNRGRFREIFCAILEQRGETLPDYRSCDEALTRVGTEPPGLGKPVYLGPSRRKLIAVIIPGIGWDCFVDWLDLKQTARKHVRQYGYDMLTLEVDALSGISTNARQIRDGIIAMGEAEDAPRLVLIGYSKGAPDILQALVTYPEIHSRVAAVVSAAGAIGGSPLANDATQSQLELLKHWPDAQCTSGDGGAVASLRPAVRKAWLAANPLPQDIPYYSLVTYPKPERISSVLGSSYSKLSKVDARNDSQLLFYDQVIPGSSLIAYANADHWALAVPIARSHSTIGSMFVDQNDYPREALLEAILRLVEEELETPID